MADIPLSLGVCVRSVLPSQEGMAQRFPRALGFRKARELSHSGNGGRGQTFGPAAGRAHLAAPLHPPQSPGAVPRVNSLGLPGNRAGDLKAASFSSHLRFFLIFSLAVTAPTQGSFWQFQRTVKHITGRSAFFSNYGYGCYCGLGGIGIPMDDTDRLKDFSCQLVLNGYQFRVANGTVIFECALGPGVSCLCGLRACECDTQSASKRTCPNFKQFFSS
ncbi:PREDICTED: LOW QUALITY PROTEIN: phospholipase A2, group IIC [Lipotes vexillifer]|uniref:LOW QUALITY PROTEIN: phospholipase A2, group IIC n=1 Tax=Lipotes vexillifer TaxID=118797 RepID=A0A340YFA9_LIPVE|nr:PREDICTED: LOW QUALITY PROTEIN: phospholipase A2, group IIC [Lipotes vexillifer]